MKKILCGVYSSLMLIWASSALAYSFGFQDIIPDNNSIDISSNFSGDVSQTGGQILFKITNNGPVTSFIGSIYWEFTPDNLLSNGAYDATNETEVGSSGGVNFVFDSKHVNDPPQGNIISFDADLESNAEKPGSGKQGVDVGETAAFLFDGDFDSIIAALQNGNLRVALHAQGIGTSGDSDSYYNKPLGVPEPATSLFFASVLVGLGLLLRKRLACLYGGLRLMS